MNKSYIELLDKFRDKENIFILGAGPSLWANMQVPFFHQLREYGIVICVNSAIMAFEEPNFWISTDSLCLRWSWFSGYIRKSNCIKIVRSSWLDKHKEEIEGFYIFEPRKTKEDEINFDGKGLMYCNGTNAAIDLGIRLLEKLIGVKRIFILGLDHGTIEGKHHFWEFLDKKNQPTQNKPAQGNWKKQKSVFSIHLQSYKALKKFAEYKNVEVYNCNENSKVEIFQKIKFEEIEKYLK